MIELNLLPDVKLEYIKAQRLRRLVTAVSLLVTVAAVALLVLLLLANALQKKHINDLNKDIDSATHKLQGQPQIGKILTVQNQLNSLTSLHNSKPAASRLFDYLNQLTPDAVSLNDLTIDFTQQTVTLTGSADSLATVNKFVDTLKFTTYDNGTEPNPSAFSNVVLTNFGLSSQATDGKPASYTINFSYDKNIFDTTQSVKLSVPNLVTTRSELDRPSDLFQASPTAGGDQ